MSFVLRKMLPQRARLKSRKLSILASMTSVASLVVASSAFWHGSSCCIMGRCKSWSRCRISELYIDFFSWIILRLSPTGLTTLVRWQSVLLNLSRRLECTERNPKNSVWTLLPHDLPLGSRTLLNSQMPRVENVTRVWLRYRSREALHRTTEVDRSRVKRKGQRPS